MHSFNLVTLHDFAVYSERRHTRTRPIVPRAVDAQGAFQDVQCFLATAASGQNIGERVQSICILRTQFDGAASFA